MSEIKKRAFRELGDSYLRDAQNEALAPVSRLSLAFDAAYMYALSVLDSDAMSLEHPHPDVLRAATSVLGWDPSVFDVAARQLNDRRATLREPGQLVELIDLAERLKVATAPSAGGQSGDDPG